MDKFDQWMIREVVHDRSVSELHQFVDSGVLSERESVEIALSVWLAITKALRSIARQRKAAEAAKVSTDMSP